MKCRNTVSITLYCSGFIFIKKNPAYINGRSESFFNNGLCLPSGSNLSSSDQNIIIDSDLRQRGSEDRANHVDLLIYDNKLEFNSDGPIKGIQFTLKSNAESFNINNLDNMDIARNKEDNLHHFAIYSISGHSIKEGNTVLFESEDKFEVVDFLVSYGNHRLVDVEYRDVILPNTFVLKQNYPNPFNPSTNIDIELGSQNNIKLVIYDIKGREVITLHNGILNIGYHTFRWDGRDRNGQTVSSGIYIYTLSSSIEIASQKMLMLK